MYTHIGCEPLQTLDETQQATLHAWLLYPTYDAPRLFSFDAYTLYLAIGAAPAADALPLVVISHGTGSSPWTLRGLAAALVGAGYAVLLIEHPGNNSRENHLGHPAFPISAALLQARPRHVRIARQAALASRLGPHLCHERYAVIGHSLGGYTALALAGARPMTLPPTIDPATPPQELAKHAIAVSIEPDPAIAAALLLAPALDFFGAPEALAQVTLPLFVRTGGADPSCPTGKILSLLGGLPKGTVLDHDEIPDAGHFAFQSPFPAAKANIPPAQDPLRFDRAGYQPHLQRTVLTFLMQHFAAPAPVPSAI